MLCNYLGVVDHANRVGEVMVVGVTLVVRQTGTRQVHLDLVELVLGDTHKLETNSVVKYLLYMCYHYFCKLCKLLKFQENVKVLFMNRNHY